MKKTIMVVLALLSVACGEDSGDPGLDAGADAGSALDGSALDGSALDGTVLDGSVLDGTVLDGSGPDGSVLEDAGGDGGVLVDGSIPDGGSSGGTVFPPRDFVCTAGAPTPCPTTVPLRSAAERTVTVTADMPSTTLTYVVHVLGMPSESPGAAAAGFNLDGMDSGLGSDSPSADCAEYATDYASTVDVGHLGVDNAISSLVPTIESLLDSEGCPPEGCVDGALAASIADGSLLLLIEIAGVESLVHDADVTVTLYAGAVPGGGPPLLDAGRLAAGQTFTTASMIGAPTSGDIFHGRLRVRPGSVVLPSTSAGGLPLITPLDRAELRADVTLTGLSRGHLGGTTPVSWYVAATDPDLADSVRSILEAFADITPGADPMVCADVSSGFTLSAVPANRTP